MSQIEYSYFAKYYAEISDELKRIKNKAEELLSEGTAVPDTLQKEIIRHTFIIDVLTRGGEEKYNKNPKELYYDGKREPCIYCKAETKIIEGAFTVCWTCRSK